VPSWLGRERGANGSIHLRASDCDRGGRSCRFGSGLRRRRKMRVWALVRREGERLVNTRRWLARCGKETNTRDRHTISRGWIFPVSALCRRQTLYRPGPARCSTGTSGSGQARRKLLPCCLSKVQLSCLAWQHCIGIRIHSTPRASYLTPVAQVTIWARVRVLRF
jgi:hypothetical protein